MLMEVKVVGCSTSWTNRPTSCYCLDDKILIDCGEGTTKHFDVAKVDFVSINKIFITHFHNDHIGGITEFLCHHCQYSDVAKRKSLTIYGPVGLKKHLDMLKYFAFGEEEQADYNLEDYINIVEIDNESELEFGDYVVKPYLLRHGKMRDIAYAFKRDGKVVGFSGDCTYDSNVERFAESCNLCFLVCCSEKTTPNHIGYDNFVQIKNKYKQNRYLAIHCVDRLYLNQDKFDIEFAENGKSYECR